MIDVIPWPSGRVRARVVDRPRARSTAEDRAWVDMCRENPRLFDAPMLSLVEMDPATGCLTAARASYRDLALGERFDTGILQLSVTAVVLRCDGAGEDRVLMARRGESTRIYPGLWEIIPAGGIDADSDFDEREVFAQAARELREEAGVDWPLRDLRLRCALIDHPARSMDLVLTARVDDPTTAPRTSWECSSFEWIPASARAIGALGAIPPAVPLARFLWGDDS